MGHIRLSVTVSEQTAEDIRRIARERGAKVSHLVEEALVEKLRKWKEARFVAQVNRVFEDPAVAAEQRDLADVIVVNADLEELPW